MALTRMSLTGYRCFAQRQDIDLAPITVVLGRNNSGKSALVRAPLVLDTGIRTDSSAPLDLDQLSEDMLESFLDLVYGHRPHGSIEIGLEFDGGTRSLTAVVQHLDEYQTQVVSALRLQDGERFVMLDWEQDEPTGTTRYTITSRDQRTVGVPVHFTGLTPTTVLDQLLVREALETAAVARACYPRIRYLGPFRDRPNRGYRLPVRRPLDVGASGESMAGILADDHQRRQGRLLDLLNEEMADDLPGWRLDMEKIGNQYAVILVSRDDDTVRVNLVDSGAGVAQALPIFVQRALDLLAPPDEPVLEIVEQPELHLHPGAHAALADLYLSAARAGKVRFLIETHSETFLLRLRRRIAESAVDPSAVAIYFVEHHGGSAAARRINVDENGGLDYWPVGVFAEDYEETRALTAAQLDKDAHVS